MRASYRAGLFVHFTWNLALAGMLLRVLVLTVCRSSPNTIRGKEIAQFRQRSGLFKNILNLGIDFNGLCGTETSKRGINTGNQQKNLALCAE